MAKNRLEIAPSRVFKHRGGLASVGKLNFNSFMVYFSPLLGPSFAPPVSLFI